MLAKLLSRVALLGAMAPVGTAATDVPAGVAVTQGPLDFLRLVMRYNLHPHIDLHPSWLPAGWPVQYRHIARFGPAGQSVLADLLGPQGRTMADYRFESRLKRLALLDAASLRRLAMYVGLGAHLPLLRQRGVAGSELLRQARRYDAGVMPFAFDRMPALPALRMNGRALQEQPAAAGRLLIHRGYRLLLGALAPEGEEVVRRVRWKFPRRLADLSVPRLESGQLRQLSELMLLCIVPERLSQWDWLL